ncbi:MAG: hypothetical protein L6422_02560 [Candidatus Marinimicrobia bacterium]|nr:helix-turn-helix domain-containing protein [bacterium]MCG2715162.1 hypothetical protein [Candidatus Neomarinimicrobiota bacterium]
MKTLEEILDVLSLKRQGYSERGIARKLGIHRKTVKKYPAAAGLDAQQQQL